MLDLELLRIYFLDTNGLVTIKYKNGELKVIISLDTLALLRVNSQGVNFYMISVSLEHCLQKWSVLKKIFKLFLSKQKTSKQNFIIQNRIICLILKDNMEYAQTDTILMSDIIAIKSP